MIEILFRGKTKQKNWVEGNGIMQGQDCISYARWVDICNDRIRYEVIPETVGRFTGLTDNNGKKIFEGDIVKNALYREMPFIVKYDQSRGGYFPFASGDGCGCCEIETITPDKNGQVDVEVIGNIYDNPELLEQNL